MHTMHDEASPYCAPAHPWATGKHAHASAAGVWRSAHSAQIPGCLRPAQKAFSTFGTQRPHTSFRAMYTWILLLSLRTPLRRVAQQLGTALTPSRVTN